MRWLNLVLSAANFVKRRLVRAFLVVRRRGARASIGLVFVEKQALICGLFDLGRLGLNFTRVSRRVLNKRHRPGKSKLNTGARPKKLQATHTEPIREGKVEGARGDDRKQ